MLVSGALRGFLARLVGWSNERTLELAVRSLKLAVEHQAALVLRGEGDLVPIAWALHRRTLGADRPFIVCDPRRGMRQASARSPANRDSGVMAYQAALGGSLCVHARWLPGDSASLAAYLRGSDSVVFIVCTEHEITSPIPVRPASIHVPPMSWRAMDLHRVVAEYAADAIAALGATASSFTDADRRWVCRHAATSYDEIEQVTLRMVALRTFANVSLAAARLEMKPSSLMRWIGRRKLPFAFDDANSRGGPKEWLARIRGGSVPWDNEAIAGLEAVLTELEARRARQKRSRGHR
jgi:hypothetical protein